VALKNSVGDVFKTVVGCAGADETDAKVISEIKIMQDALESTTMTRSERLFMRRQ